MMKRTMMAPSGWVGKLSTWGLFLLSLALWSSLCTLLCTLLRYECTGCKMKMKCTKGWKDFKYLFPPQHLVWLLSRRSRRTWRRGESVKERSAPWDAKKSSTWLLSPIALEVLQELAESHFTAEYIFVSAIGEMILQYNFLQFFVFARWKERLCTCRYEGGTYHYLHWWKVGLFCN